MTEERPYFSSPTVTSSQSRKWILTLVGTFSVVLIAGLIFQFVRTPQGQAQERAANNKKAKQETTKVVARVNEIGISYDEVAAECMLRHGTEVLDDLINRKIIDQACEAKGISVSESEVEAEVKSTADKFGMSIEQWYQMLKTERQVTPAQYRRDIIWPMVALRKLAGGEIKITKSEMQKGFEKFYGSRVKARLIVCDKQKAAHECWEKLQENPDEWKTLVKEYSVDPASRPLDGSVPPIRRFSGNPVSANLEEEAFKLKAGEVSKVIQVGEQYVILICDGRTEPIVTDMKEVEAELFDTLKDEKTQMVMSQVFEKLKADARVDNYLSGQTTGGSKRSPINQVKASSEDEEAPPKRTTKKTRAQTEE